MMSSFDYSLESAIEFGPASKWLSKHNEITKIVDDLKMDYLAREDTKRHTLFKMWSAQVYAPLAAVIRSKMDSDGNNVFMSKQKLYQSFLEYCNHPYTVLSLSQPTENYDPFSVTRGHSFCVHVPVLQDPLFLAARERCWERLMRNPDWPVYPQRIPSSSDAYQGPSQKKYSEET